MAYALGLNGSSCGCSTSDSTDTSDVLSMNGMYIKDALMTDLLIDQGITSEMLLCFTSGSLSPEIKCIRDDGTLLFDGSADLCFKANDIVRIINLDSCRQDGSEIYQVAANPTLVDEQWEVRLQANPANALAGTPAGAPFTDAIADLQFVNGVYCFSAITTKRPVGCVTTTTQASQTPRLIMHRPANNMVINGAVTYRDDLHLELGVSSDGTNWLTTTAEVTGRVNVGDYITSPEGGINLPLRILQVRKVEVNKDDGSGTEYIERWQVERPITANTCMLAYIRRGTTMNFETIMDAGCARIVIPGSMTSGLQLGEAWKTDEGVYHIGHYTITATWAVLRNGVLAPRSDVIKAGEVYVRPTHHFSVTV